MIKTKTLLILGAGASVEFDFPTGKELLKEVLGGLQKVPGDEEQQKDLLKCLLKVGGAHDKANDPNNIEHFRKALSETLDDSIDAFLGHNPNKVFETIGKRAIAYVLLQCENTEKLAEMKSQAKANWYELLSKALTEDEPFEKVNKNKTLSIITFNYDRSLEYHLHRGLNRSYLKGGKECTEKLSTIPIIHVHGKLGKLEWQQDDPETQIKYGSVLKTNIDRKASIVNQAAENIKIIPNDINNTPEFEKAREKIKWAGRIFILGFGFNAKNLERLQLGPLRKDRGGVFGTGKNLGSKEIRIIEDLKIPNMIGIETDRVLYGNDDSRQPFPDKTVYEFLRFNVDLTS